MIKTTLILFTSALSFAASAAPVDIPPPIATNVKAQVTEAPRSVSANDMRLEPNEADLLKAREARSKKRTQAEVYVADKGTKIETYNDQFNHRTHVRVTPHETEIPYVMQNKSNRSMDNGPTTNTRSTLGTPQFVNITW